MNLAVLVTTFNQPNSLDLVLDSLTKQTRKPDQIIVCDDGSRTETTSLINNWKDRLPVIQVWEKDEKFRAARARNLGLAKTNADYVVLVDGDCLLPPSFLHSHLRLSQRGYLVSGGRHMLSKSETERRLHLGANKYLSLQHWKFMAIPLGIVRDMRPRSWETVRTCNLSLYRSDALAVGGFDESFIGWGKEDSDFVIRLINNGVNIRSGRLAACVAHLHHRESSRAQTPENEKLMRYTLNNPQHISAHKSILKSS